MKKTRLTTYKSFRVKPDLRLQIALASNTLDMTESDFIRECINNQILRLQTENPVRKMNEQPRFA